MSHPELLISNQLCFLIHRLDKALIGRYRPLLESLGLTYPQYLAMLALWEHRELEVGQLCATLGLDTGTVSPLLKRLESAGLIERRRSRKDERVVAVSLSDKGRALEEAARAVPSELAACVGLSEEEYLRLKSELSALLKRAEAT